MAYWDFMSCQGCGDCSACYGRLQSEYDPIIKYKVSTQIAISEQLYAIFLGWA